MRIMVFPSTGKVEDEVLDDYRRANLNWWNERVAHHVRSAFYDVAAFKVGKTSLDEIVLQGVGLVSGKSLLHLQCHFGLDTLSWARLGAKVTGIDFSEEAITKAVGLTAELGLDARFIKSDIYTLPDLLDETFDIVFTSYGALPWLPDVRAWARVVARYLEPGGVFFIAEGHPLASMLAEDEELRIRYPYFSEAEKPQRFDAQGSYADRDADCANTTTYEWNHPLGDVVTALIDAGLALEWVREYPECPWQCLPAMRRGEGGWWRLPAEMPQLPSIFTIRARRVP